jgi:regulator of nucleoside diphosphate kinase
METKEKSIVVLESDYDLMWRYIRGTAGGGTFDNKNAFSLQEELKRATIVKKSIFPKKVVRVNSRVLVREESGGKILDLTVVTPEKADMKERRVSFMAPIGMALLGFKEGDRVKWQVPSGEKIFVIVKVEN